MGTQMLTHSQSGAAARTRKRRSAAAPLAHRRPMRRLVTVAVLAAVSPAVIGGLWGWFCAHPPRIQRPADEPLEQAGIPYVEIDLLTADGLRLAGWYTPSANGATILVAHGYFDVRPAEIHTLFAQAGYGVLSWDFRAHGRSEGELCTVGYYETLDVEAALDHALAQGGVQWIGLWGGSMGGIAGLRAAIRRPEIRAIVLDSVPTSLEGAFETTVKPALLRHIVRYVAEREAKMGMTEIRPVDRIGQISPRPVLIIQSADDHLIPADSGQLLFRAAGEPRSLWLVPHADHLEAFQEWPEAYTDRVITFFEEARRADSLGTDGR